MTPDEWNHILNTNLTSVFNCCRLAVPMMVSRKSGRILNISSVWGVCGASCEVAYSATKGGINAMTRALAKELAPSSIQVNAIACGAIDTEMNQFLDEEERNALLEEIPAGRMGRAEEVGKLAYQLGSEDSYLTGQIIQLDGGWIQKPEINKRIIRAADEIHGTQKQQHSHNHNIHSSLSLLFSYKCSRSFGHIYSARCPKAARPAPQEKLPSDSRTAMPDRCRSPR